MMMSLNHSSFDYTRAYRENSFFHQQSINRVSKRIVVASARNPGEKASGLLFWEFESPLYIERDAEDALLQIPRTQARRVVGAVRSDGQLPSV